MASIPLTQYTRAGSFVCGWIELEGPDDGEPWGISGQTDKTVTIDGASGFALQGSNDLEHWHTLHDIDMTTEITGDGIFVIKESPVWIRPLGAATSVIINAR